MPVLSPNTNTLSYVHVFHKLNVFCSWGRWNFKETAPSHVACIEKTNLRTKETFSLVLIKRDIIEKRSDNFTEEWVLVLKCICQSNVKSFKSVADDIRQPKLSHVKLWTQKRVNSLLPGKDKTRANKLKPIKSHLRSNKQNQGWKIKLHYVVADGLIEGHCICLLQQICC